MMKRMYGLVMILAVFVTWMALPPAQHPPRVPGEQNAPSPPPAATPTTTPSQVTTNQQAVPTTEVPSPAEPPHSTEQAQWALGVSLLLEYLKKTKWFKPITDGTSGRIMAAVGFATAVLTALSIKVSIHGSFWDAGGMDVSFGHISWVMFTDVPWQWITQQAWYLAVVKRGQTLGH